MPEIQAVVDQRIEANRAATLRAGLIAAMIVNVNRAPGTPLVHPEDFVAGPDEYLTPEEAADFMDRWAASQGGTIVAPTDAEVEKYTKGG